MNIQNYKSKFNLILYMVIFGLILFILANSDFLPTHSIEHQTIEYNLNQILSKTIEYIIENNRCPFETTRYINEDTIYNGYFLSQNNLYKEEPQKYAYNASCLAKEGAYVITSCINDNLPHNCKTFTHYK